MPIVSLTDTRSRTDFFRQTILTNLQYWQKWQATGLTDPEALDRERSNIFKAIAFGLDLEVAAWSTVRTLIEALSPHMERRGHWDAWHRLLQRAITVARQSDDMVAVVNLSTLVARLLFRQSRFRESVAYYRQVIRVARQIEDRFSEARACTNLGFYYIEQGHWRRAEALCCHALEIFEQLDNNHGRAHTENHLGILYTLRGMWTEAESHLTRACTIWQVMDDKEGLLSGYNNLGRLFNEMARRDEALVALEEAARCARQVGEEIRIGNIYVNMGIAYRQKGDAITAKECYREAEAIFRRFSHLIGLAEVQDNLGLVYLDQHQWPEARSHLQTGLRMWRSLGHVYNEIQALIYLAEYEVTRKKSREAEHWLDEAESLLDQHNRAKRYPLLGRRIKELRRSLEK